jgi:hypothetical protein
LAVRKKRSGNGNPVGKRKREKLSLSFLSWGVVLYESLEKKSYGGNEKMVGPE